MNALTQRLALDATNTELSTDALVLEFYRGLPLRVAVALLEGATPASVAEVNSLTLRVRTSREDTASAPLMSKTVSEFTSCTAEQWAAMTHQQALFEFSAAECNLAMTGTKRTLWLVVTALLDDGSDVVVGTGKALLYESNAAAVADPPTNPDPALTVEQGDARYATIAAIDAIKFVKTADRITFPDGKFIFLNQP